LLSAAQRPLNASPMSRSLLHTRKPR